MKPLTSYSAFPATSIGKYKIILLLLFYCCGTSINTVFAQQVKKIELLHANSLEFDESKGTRAKRLIGNVAFKHENAIMKCDSAYLFSETNSLNAYGNVRINQGDTLNLYGDSLNYNGNTRFAKLRNNIRLIQNNMLLTTQYLDYDLGKNFGYYIDGGKIVSNKDKNTLTSKFGYYYPATKGFHFKDSVVLINPDYRITSDTLVYNTETEVTYFFGPSTIKSDSNLIYCENGWYDTKKGLAQFNENAYVQTRQQTLKGDSIFYNRNKGIGEAFGNVEILDTIEDILINGEYAINHENDSTTLVTGMAMLTNIFGEDSLFLHADTLFAAYDITRKHRMMFAYHRVKFFKPDMQGKCDSMVFSNADSTLKLYRDPILWSSESQITAIYIELKQYDGEIKSMRLDSNAFIISQEDSVKYNQIKGKNMFGYFKDNTLYKIDVTGNGQSIYYAKDDSTLIGMNKAECSNMIIWVDSNKVEKITFLKEPKATLFPMEKVKPGESLLRGFIWRGKSRPLVKEDIFIWDESD